MDKDYLIQFNTDGTRLNTYANGVHYQIIEPQPIIETKIDKETGEAIEEVTGYTEEEILNIVDGFDYQSVIENGGVWFGQNDYNKLVGNDNGKEYIYKDGEIIEKQEQEQEIVIDNDYINPLLLSLAEAVADQEARLTALENK